MLLAAGEGRRLRPFTDDRPKPMIAIAGRPILEHTVRLLARYGVRDLAINLHYHPESIVDHFGDGRRFGVRIQYSRESELLGTAGAVKKLESFFDEPFLVVYGDNLTDIDVERFSAFHRAHSALVTIALFHRENATASGIVGFADDGRVTRFLEKPRPDEIFSNWVNAGILIAEPAILAHIPSAGPSDFGRDVLPALLAAGLPVFGYRMTENLYWIDSPEDYQRTQELVTSL
ncbi:MAG: nucleotidyltransferase family protein [Acidobacteriota bacterium]|nr:nucleotidyltransferase family protein [Acidobacteriota bacterium]